MREMNVAVNLNRWVLAVSSTATGASVAHCHLRYLNPFPSNLGDILNLYEKVLIPELNLGQLRTLIRAKYLVEAEVGATFCGLPLGVFEVLPDDVGELARPGSR